MPSTARAKTSSCMRRRFAVAVLLLFSAACAMAADVLSFEIHGKVQGVFFRKHTQAEATKLKLRGWCENTKADTVRGESSDAAALDKFKQWLSKKGSPKSRIDKADFSTTSRDPSALQSPFAIVK